MSLKTVLVLVPVNAEQLHQLETTYKASYVYRSFETYTLEDVLKADIIIGNAKPEWVKQNDHLILLQLNSAGTDGYVDSTVIKGATVLTNSTGAYGLAISEYLVGMTFVLAKNMAPYWTQQNDHIWRDLGPVKAIKDTEILVVGMGDIGEQYAEKMVSLGAHVTGIRRTLRPARNPLIKIETMDHLKDILGQFDFVVLALPSTPETYHLWDKEKLALMKPHSYLMNVGRGNVLVNSDLIEALSTRHLAGAYGDTWDEEPLPSDSPLWDTPNLMITPHITGYYHLKETLQFVVDIACYNLEAVAGKHAYKNIVDFKTGYRKL